MKILYEKSNEEHRLTSSQIISELSNYGISAERKSIYSDLESLRMFGFDISSQEDNIRGNYLGERYFQLSEVKMLIDVIQAADFISEKKSLELIEKLGRFVSEHDRKVLKRQIVLANRVKSSNETIYYSIDSIYKAIYEKKTVRFKYYNLDVHKNKIFRNNGEFYYVNPIALVWDDERYYLVAFDDKDEKLKHYRVDKMESVVACDKDISELSQNVYFDAAQCSKQSFNMFSGDVVSVTLKVDNKASSIIYDKFGTDVFVIPNEDNTFNITVDVAVSPQFYSWIFGVCEYVSIVAPKSVVKDYHDMALKVAERHS